MNKKEAIKNAKQVFPNLKPCFAASMTTTDDGKGVLIACTAETPTVLIIHNHTDLWRIRNMIDYAIKNHEKT